MICAGGMMTCKSVFSRFSFCFFLSVFFISGTVLGILREKVLDVGLKIASKRLAPHVPLIDQAAKLKEIFDVVQRDGLHMVEELFLSDEDMVGGQLVEVCGQALQHPLFQKISDSDVFVYCKEMMPAMWDRMLAQALVNDGSLVDWYLEQRAGTRSAHCFVFDDRSKAKVVSFRLSAEAKASSGAFCAAVADLAKKREYVVSAFVFTGNDVIDELQTHVEDIAVGVVQSKQPSILVCQGKENKDEWWLIYLDGSSDKNSALLTVSEASCLAVASMVQMVKRYVTGKREYLRIHQDEFDRVRELRQHKQLFDMFLKTTAGEALVKQLKHQIEGLRSLYFGAFHVQWQDVGDNVKRLQVLQQKRKSLLIKPGGRAQELKMTELSIETEQERLADLCSKAADHLSGAPAPQGVGKSRADMLVCRAAVAFLLEHEASMVSKHEENLSRQIGHAECEMVPDDVEAAVALIEGKLVRDGCKAYWMMLVDKSEQMLTENAQISRLDHLRVVVKSLHVKGISVPDDVSKELKSLEARVGHIKEADACTASLDCVDTRSASFWFGEMVHDLLELDFKGIGSGFMQALEGICERVC